MPDDIQIEEVNTPKHYTSGSIECIDALEAALTPEEFQGFLKGNIMKYLWRAGKKTDSSYIDLRKAEWYLAKLLGKISDKEIAHESTEHGIMGMCWGPRKMGMHWGPRKKGYSALDEKGV